MSPTTTIIARLLSCTFFDLMWPWNFPLEQSNSFKTRLICQVGVEACVRHEDTADLALTDDANTVKLIDFARGENSSSQLCQMPDGFSKVGRKTRLRTILTHSAFLVGAFWALFFKFFSLFMPSGIK